MRSPAFDTRAELEAWIAKQARGGVTYERLYQTRKLRRWRAEFWASDDRPLVSRDAVLLVSLLDTPGGYGVESI